MTDLRNSPSRPRDGREVLNLPLGYRFYPSDDQVIHYLKLKIFGEELPADIILTIDVYSQSPDQLPLDEFKYGVAGEWFFFTTRLTRLAGDLLTADGYWSPTGLPTDVELDDRIIGFKEVLHFYWGCSPNGIKSNWTIYEYRLNPDELEAGQLDEPTKAKVQNFVACRVRNTEKFQVTSDWVQENCGIFPTNEFGFLTSTVMRHRDGNRADGDENNTDGLN